MVKVFELAGDKVKLSVAQTLMQLIAEGAEAADEEDEGACVRVGVGRRTDERARAGADLLSDIDLYDSSDRRLYRMQIAKA